MVYSAATAHALRRREHELVLSLPLLGTLPELTLLGTHYYLFGRTPLALRLQSYVAMAPSSLGPAQLRPAAEPAASDGSLSAAELNERGKQHYDHGRTAEAIADFEAALQRSAPAGQISLAANSARHYAALIFRQTKDADAAEQILDRYEPLLRLQAIEHAAATFERALYAASRGELVRAQSFYRLAMAEAVAVDYPELRRTVQSSYVAFLHQQGEHAAAKTQAAAVSRDLAALSLDQVEQPCSRSRELAVLARAQLNAAETVPALAQTARETLAQALQFADRDACRDQAALAHLYSSAARASLRVAEGQSAAQPMPPSALSALLGEAEARVSQALATQPRLSPLQRMDLGELLGRLALLRQDYAGAIPLLRDAELLARRGLVADLRYRALIALAIAQDALAQRLTAPFEATTLTQQAEQNFAAAEQLLSDLVLFVPLPAARRGFLPRYEWGLSAYIDSLLRRGDHQAALGVMRRAQVRGLALTFQAGLLDPGKAAQAQALQQDAAALLQQSLQRQDRLPVLSSDTPQSLQEQRQRLDDLLRRLRQAGLGGLPLRPLRPGEALLICHPLPQQRIACIYALSDGRLDSLRLPLAELDTALSAVDAPRRLSRLLLLPFAPLLADTAVLRIIQSPLLRSIEFAALPHPLQADSLATRGRSVVYALDVDPRALPAQPAASQATPPPAMVVVYGHLFSTAQLTPPLLRRLRQLGFRPSLYATPRMEHGYAPLRRLRCWLGLVNNCAEPLLPAEAPEIPLFTGSAASVLSGLQGVGLAHFYTHAEFGREQGGWESAILMPDRSSLRAAELMRLAPAPRHTVLITCEGGQSAVGDEADDISLAQALLLRGGEAVVAANQKLLDSVGAAWTRALYDAAPHPPEQGAPYLSAAQPDLAAAFHHAQLALRAQSPARLDWTALRLYVL